MITGLILLASVARANCIDLMEAAIKRDCVEPASISEIRGGDTQFFSCESDTDSGVSVFVFSVDPDLVEAMRSEPEMCTGGSLYLSDSKSLDAILSGLSVYVGSVAGSIRATP